MADGGSQVSSHCWSEFTDKQGKSRMILVDNGLGTVRELLFSLMWYTCLHRETCIDKYIYMGFYTYVFPVLSDEGA